jgi:predicted CXXCH cytochrome family protein
VSSLPGTTIAYAALKTWYHWRRNSYFSLLPILFIIELENFMSEKLPTSSPQRNLAIVGLFLGTAVVVAVSLVWWAQQRIRDRESQEVADAERPLPPIEIPPPPDMHYVGSESCRECHAEVFEKYQTHPKYHSIVSVADEPTIEDYDAETRFAPIPERQYEVQREEGEVRHHELGFDRDGELIYDQGEPVHYGIGSGKRLRSYILDREGHLFLSPISWFSEPGHWELSVGYDQFPHARFDNVIGERCANCHSGHYVLEDRTSTTAAPRFEPPGLRELAISCERCHGPGGEHVRLRREQGDQVTEDPMLRLSSLQPGPRDSVCNQCHIHAEHEVVRFGRRYDDFRPGDNVGDIVSLFVSGVDPREPAPNHHRSPAEQIRLSQCSIRSDRALGCTTCHDPHQVPEPANVATYYRQRCFTCHDDGSCSLPLPQQEAAPASGSCIACHMPPEDDLPLLHATRTDHRILRDPSRENGSPPAAGGRGQLPKIFDLIDAPLTDGDETRAMGLMYSERAASRRSRQDATQAESLLTRSLPATQGMDARVFHGMAIAMALMNRTDEALELLQITTRIDPTREEAWYDIAAATQTSQDFAASRRYAERLVRLNPWRAEWHGRFAQVLATAAQPEAAIRSAQKALELDPSSLPVWNLLNALHQLLGNEEEAAEAQKMLERLMSAVPEN